MSLARIAFIVGLINAFVLPSQAQKLEISVVITDSETATKARTVKVDVTDNTISQIVINTKDDGERFAIAKDKPIKYPVKLVDENTEVEVSGWGAGGKRIERQTLVIPRDSKTQPYFKNDARPGDDGDNTAQQGGRKVNPKITIEKLTEKGPQVVKTPKIDLKVKRDFVLTAGKGPLNYKIETEYGSTSRSETRAIDGNSAEQVIPVTLEPGPNSIIITVRDKGGYEVAGHQATTEIYCVEPCIGDGTKQGQADSADAPVDTKLTIENVKMDDPVVVYAPDLAIKLIRKFDQTTHATASKYSVEVKSKDSVRSGTTKITYVGTPADVQEIGLKLDPGQNVVKVKVLDKDDKPIPGIVSVRKILCAGTCSTKSEKSAYLEILGNEVERIVQDPDYVLQLKPSFKGTHNGEKIKNFSIEVRSGDKLKSNVYGIAWESDGVPNPVQELEIELLPGKNTVSVKAIGENGKAIDDIFASGQVFCTGTCGMVTNRSINTRTIVGLEQVGASSSEGKTQPFMNFFVNVPLRNPVDKLGRPSRGFSVWTDFRLTSTSVQKFADLGNIGASIVGTQPAVSDVVQSFKINVGGDFELVREKFLFPSFLKRSRSSLSFIFGAGVTSPLTSTLPTGNNIFIVPRVGGNANGSIIEDFKKAFPEVPETAVNVAFLNPERDRFLRRYFGGARLKTFFYKNDTERLDLSPATLDLTFGQDEAITKKLQGVVLTFEGFAPLPIPSADYLFLYGGISTRLKAHANVRINSFQLRPASNFNLDDPGNIFYVSADHENLRVQKRDTYFFGIGVDLVKLFRKGSTPAPQ
jgi:hypothetical protein